MKVLFITKEYPPHVYGGAGVHVEYLASELSKLISVEVRAFGQQNDRKDDLIVKGYESPKESFNHADQQLKSIFNTLATDLEIAAPIVDADVVHCHTWYSHFAGIMAKLCYGKPLVLTTHSLEPLRPWKREQLGKGYDMSSWIEKTAIEMADGIIAVSEGTKSEVLEHFKVDEDKIEVIYNGIDLQQYQMTHQTTVLQEYGIDPDKPYVLFVGRITRQKGIIHLVRAIEFINEGVQVVLCAGAPDTDDIAIEMTRAVEKASHNRDDIFWIDKMLDKQDIIQLYSHAALFCCPSIYEPFGIINIEAMACKTPVVASAVGGIKEVVIHEETGLLVPVEQQKVAPFEPIDADKFSKDLANAINTLLEDKKLRQTMAKNSRQRVEEHFDWKAIAKQTKNMYHKIIAKNV